MLHVKGNNTFLQTCFNSQQLNLPNIMQVLETCAVTIVQSIVINGEKNAYQKLRIKIYNDFQTVH